MPLRYRIRAFMAIRLLVASYKAWIRRVWDRMSAGDSDLEQSDFEKMREALKPSQPRAAPPRPVNPPPPVQRRTK